MGILVFVGGAAASGKSTLVHELVKELQACYYRPSQAYIDLANAKGIDKQHAFTKITPKEAEDYFLNICMSYQLIIGDQHYAIQPVRDSVLATTQKSIKTNENYQAALSVSFINNIKLKCTRVIAFLLFAPAEILYERAKQRECAQVLRSSSISDVEDEMKAEYENWKLISQIQGIKGKCIDVSKHNKNESLRIVREYIIDHI